MEPDAARVAGVRHFWKPLSGNVPTSLATIRKGRPLRGPQEKQEKKKAA